MSTTCTWMLIKVSLFLNFFIFGINYQKRTCLWETIHVNSCKKTWLIHVRVWHMQLFNKGHKNEDFSHF